MTGPPVVRLYIRDGCHLCEEARAMIEELRAGGESLALELVDIETDDDLHRAYLERIPVAEVGERTAFELIPDRDALLGMLRGSGTL